MSKNKGYRNRKERIRDAQDQAAKIWQSAYTSALGWSPDPEGEAHKAMSAFLANKSVA